ncbi:MAG: 3-phosphoshikimate 1-carboxyvinyltransferase [Phycisphaerales bacterium JB039]
MTSAAEALSGPLEQLPDPLPITPMAPGPRRVEVRPPGSKSLTNRAILLGALASGRSELRCALTEADDTRRMLEAVRRLGAGVEVDGETIRIEGAGGRWRPAGDEVQLDLGNAGTATRFCAAAALLSPVPVLIDGDARMRQRPIGELAAALRSLGAQVEELGAAGCPPVRVRCPDGPPREATVSLGPTSSSQFISALLLIGPWLPGGLTVRLEGEITSRSYVEMTVGLLDRLGAQVRLADELRVIRIGGAGVGRFTLEIEPDASGATALWAAAALTPALTCAVRGLDPGASLQGDARFPETLARMGAQLEEPGAVTGGGGLRPVLADMRDMPDAAMALIATCALAPDRSVLRGLQTLRVKETDRLAAMQRELGKVGVTVQLDLHGEPGAIAVIPPAGGMAGGRADEVIFDTYNDHRMAMSMALIGLRRPNVLIRDPGCVRKTYPGFWRDWGKLHG